MPRNARSRLPAQVADFLDAFALTGDARSAAIGVGCHPKNALAFARDTLAHPDAAAVFDSIMRTRFAEAGPVALNLVLQIVQGTMPADTRTRLDAAKTLLDRSGYSAKALATPGAPKDLHELSRDELLRVIDQGESELASRAKLIDQTPIADALDVQVIDMEE